MRIRKSTWNINPISPSAVVTPHQRLHYGAVGCFFLAIFSATWKKTWVAASDRESKERINAKVHRAVCSVTEHFIVAWAKSFIKNKIWSQNFPHGPRLLRPLKISMPFDKILRSIEAEALRTFGPNSEIGCKPAGPLDEFVWAGVLFVTDTGLRMTELGVWVVSKKCAGLLALSHFQWSRTHSSHSVVPVGQWRKSTIFANSKNTLSRRSTS
jgi:hypothetical protein